MAQREVELFERVVLPHLDDAYALARNLLRDEHDAQDVVQEAVLRGIRYFDGFRDGDPRAWLLAIVRNCCHTWHRRRSDAEFREVVLLVDLEDQSYADVASTLAIPVGTVRSRLFRARRRLQAPLMAFAEHAGVGLL